MAHTKAPWIVRPFDLDDITNPVREVETSGETWQYQEWAIIDPVTQRTVATVGWRADLGGWGPTRDREEAIANRALVMAAPCLLAALEAHVAYEESVTATISAISGEKFQPAPWLAAARKAIAKAKGQTEEDDSERARR